MEAYCVMRSGVTHYRDLTRERAEIMADIVGGVAIPERDLTCYQVGREYAAKLAAETATNGAQLK